MNDARVRITAIYDRVSNRSFRKEPIPDAALIEILNAATRAPTSGNMQPWEFIIVDDASMKTEVAKTTFSGYFSKGTAYQKWIEDAGVIIVTLANQKRTGARYGSPGYEWALLDVAAAIQNMLLTITALGLSSCWVGGFREEELRQLLRIPDYAKPVGLLPIGHPKNLPKPKSRLSLRWVTHRGTYGNSYYP